MESSTAEAHIRYVQGACHTKCNNFAKQCLKNLQFNLVTTWTKIRINTKIAIRS